MAETQTQTQVSLEKDQTKAKDNWSSSSYQSAAAFVPQMTTTVVEWLDLQPGDRVLDVGCGDGVLTNRLATLLSPSLGGHIHGIDASLSMLATARATIPAPAAAANAVSYTHLDANALITTPNITFPVPVPVSVSVSPEGTATAVEGGSGVGGGAAPQFTKIFSNAALHWILTPHRQRNIQFFASLIPLVPSRTGQLIFEMGGLFNCPEAHTALLFSSAKRLPGGITAARALDPWFFPDEGYISAVLEDAGWEIEKCERVPRRTVVQKKGETAGPEGKGGLEGWVRLMGSVFLDGVAEAVASTEVEKQKVREEMIREVVDVLRTVCGVPEVDEKGGLLPAGSGELLLGYVRLRVKARRRA